MPVTKNVIVAGWSGTLGKQVVFRQRDGKTIASAYPDMSKRKLSAKQIRMNNLMREANEYAQEIVADEKQCQAAQIRLDVRRNKLYTSLVREYLIIHKKAETGQIPAAADKENLFVKYLLQNTNKTDEEIAELAKVSVEFVREMRGVL